MKVYGQLEVAQLEQIAATTTTPTPTGRIYADTTNANAAIPRFYNGTAWLPIQLGQSGSAPVSQNSGTACTVNWANGLIQEVVLTGNCTISFSNPQSGYNHVLIITQNPYASSLSQYAFVFNMIDQDSRRGGYQPNQLQPTQNGVYQWYYYSAIKPGYATVPTFVSIPNANFLPAVASVSCALLPDNSAVSIMTGTTPFGGMMRIIDGYWKPQILPWTVQTAWAGAMTQCQYSPDGQYLFAVGGTTPFIQARPTHSTVALGYGPGIAATSGTTNPGTLPAGAAQCVTVHPLGNYVVCGHTTTPFMSGYAFDAGSGFGTKLGDPVTLPLGSHQVNGIAFSPLGDFLAVAGNSTPFINVYPFGSAYGTIVANPSSLPTAGPSGSQGKVLAWRPQGDYIAMISSSSSDNYLYIVAFNRATGSFGAKVTNSYVPAGALTCVQWTPDGQYLVCGSASSPYLIILDFSSGSISSTAITRDSTDINQTVNDVSIASHGEWVACALNATPYFKINSLPTKVRNYLRLAI